MTDAFPLKLTTPEPPGTAGTAPTAGASHATLQAQAVEWMAGRGIGRETLSALGVTCADRFFGDIQKTLPAIIFRYGRGSWKARSFPEKHFTASKGFEMEFWNLERVLAANPEQVFITEGETDACALVEAGVPMDRVLSVPNGAKLQAAEDPNARRGYQYVKDALAAGLNRCKQFIWCGDQDAAGIGLRSDMARLLPTALFHYVEWPEGCKDANDLLLAEGGQYLLDYVTEQAKPWPIVGLFKLSEIPEPPPIETWMPGFPQWENKVRLAPRTLSVVTGQPNHGKALALDTPIPTPSGWTTMGLIKPGDVVFDESGSPCRVTFVTPVMFNHDCYRVNFGDGASIVADADHLWLTETEADRQRRYGQARRGSAAPRQPSVKTTEDIANTIFSNNGKINHTIPHAGALSLPANLDLPLPPYLLGVWLGDGNSRGAIITCHMNDRQIIAEVESCGFPVRKMKQQKNRSSTWSLSDGVYRGPNKPCVTKTLRAMGLIKNKHIPSAYLRGSIADRMSLLQGLMDTDGCITSNGCEFTSTSKALAYGALELVRSLGIRASMVTGRATLYGKDCGPKYRVIFVTTKPVFRLQRKLIKIPLRQRKVSRGIVSCHRVPSVPVRCIQVDSPSHLYLASEWFIPTHNTALFQQIWFNIVRDYNLVCSVASFETRAKPHIRRQLRTLLSGKLEVFMSEEEKARADKWINDHYVFSIHPEQRATLGWFLDTAAAAVVRHGAKIIQLDPWNRLEAAREKNETETEYIGRCLRELHSFAMDMNCHVQILAHPSKIDSTRHGAAPTLEDISGSKHWENMVDQGFTVHRPKLFEGADRKTEAVLYHRKARFEELGWPCKLMLDYKLEKGKFESVDYDVTGIYA